MNNFPDVQIAAVETLLKNPKIGVSELAKKSGLVSFENDHTAFLSEELRRLRLLGILKAKYNKKTNRFHEWEVVNPDEVRKIMGLRKRDKYFKNWLIKVL